MDGGPLPYAQLTGDTCEFTEDPPLQEGCTQLPNGSIECEEEEEEQEPTVLQCSSDSCPNPNNLRCPSGYVSGTVNGQRVCARSNTPEPDPECEGDCDETQNEIAAINDAKNGIIDSINQLYMTIENGFDSLISLLNQKLSSSGDGDGDGDGDGHGTPVDTGGNWGNPDTSGFNAEMPYSDSQPENNSFNQNIYNSDTQCPSDRTLNLDLMGRSFTYTFSYSHICDGLAIIGLFILIMCYLFAAHIVVKE